MAERCKLFTLTVPLSIACPGHAQSADTAGAGEIAQKLEQEPADQMEGISIGKNGLLICVGRTPQRCGDASQKDDPIEFTFSPGKAEPLRVAFISADARVAMVLVPDPVRSTDKNCTLEVVRLLPNFELGYFMGSGFTPNARVEFDSQSYDEKHRLESTANADGNLEFATLPLVSGHNNGTMKVKALGTQCSPAVQFDGGH